MLSGLFVPRLAGKDQAAIVNVSSGLGFVPAARMPDYSAAKAAMKGLEGDVPEIGYGFTAEALTASRAELDRRFQQMNARW